MVIRDRLSFDKISLPQLMIGLALLVLMAVTRGQHFASVDALPSASWAVFFIAGVYLRSHWSFTFYMAAAVLLDLSSLAAGASIADCITPSYIALIPAYASLWLAGRWFAQKMTLNAVGILRLTMAMVCGLVLAQLISSGSYYLFSGQFANPTIAEFVERMVAYTPRRLESLAFYIGMAACVHVISFELRRLGSRFGFSHE
ncbi:hypothetical protein [Neptunomonas phycophila]|uniref:hypothetical protein n=1 Tax=Neptunomonas phycophila TaxID=1572645 RepID=UPI000948A72B|nr:hypothetical protein [Neptunomonas phycophila]